MQSRVRTRTTRRPARAIRCRAMNSWTGCPPDSTVSMSASPPRPNSRPDAARRREARHPPKTLDAVRPSEGLAVAYQRKLERLVDDLHGSLLWWLRSAYRANAPEMAADASPARELQDTMRRLARRWQG